MRSSTGHAMTMAGPGRPNCPRALRRIKEIYGGLGGLGFPCSNMKLPLSAALKCASSYGHFTALDSCSLCLCWKGIRSFQKYFHPCTGTSLFFIFYFLKRGSEWPLLWNNSSWTASVSQVLVRCPAWCDFVSSKWRMKAEVSLFHSSFIGNWFSVFLCCGEMSCWIPTRPCKLERKTVKRGRWTWIRGFYNDGPKKSEWSLKS